MRKTGWRTDEQEWELVVTSISSGSLTFPSSKIEFLIIIFYIHAVFEKRLFSLSHRLPIPAERKKNQSCWNNKKIMTRLVNYLQSHVQQRTLCIDVEV